MIQVFKVKVEINGHPRAALMANPIVGERTNRAWMPDFKSASAYDNNGREFFAESLCKGQFSYRPICLEIGEPFQVSVEMAEEMNW